MREGKAERGVSLVGGLAENISVHIQRLYKRVVSVRCKTHATAWLTSPSFWPPPIDAGDLFWIIFRGQSVARLLSLSFFLSLCRSFGLCGKKWGFARTGARFSAEFRCARERRCPMSGHGEEEARRSVHRAGRNSSFSLGCHLTENPYENKDVGQLAKKNCNIRVLVSALFVTP